VDTDPRSRGRQQAVTVTARYLPLEVPAGTAGPRDERGPYAVGPGSGLLDSSEVAVRIYPRVGRPAHEWERAFAPCWLVGEPSEVCRMLDYSIELTIEQRATLREGIDQIRSARWDWIVACRTRLAPRLLGEGTYVGDREPQHRMFGNHAHFWRAALVVAPGHHAVRIEDGEDATETSLRWSVEEWLVGPIGDLSVWLGNPGKEGPAEVRHALRYRGAFAHTAAARLEVEKALTRSTGRAR
jgi:hypothetical protein